MEELDEDEEDDDDVETEDELDDEDVLEDEVLLLAVSEEMVVLEDEVPVVVPVFRELFRNVTAKKLPARIMTITAMIANTVVTEAKTDSDTFREFSSLRIQL
jgi:hypothetical protein